MYIALDNEMGGVTLDYSLLTSYLVVLDVDLNPIDDLELYVKPDDGIYRVCGQAMNVNKIDLAQHDTKAIYYKEAGTKLYQFLKKNSDSGKIKLTPIGHGIYGDIAFITHCLMKTETWETFTSYRKLDTQAVCQFLKLCGKFPEGVSGSLESLGKHFGILRDENRNCFNTQVEFVTGDLHNAKTDTLLTVEVLKHLKTLV